MNYEKPRADAETEVDDGCGWRRVEAMKLKLGPYRRVGRTKVRVRPIYVLDYNLDVVVLRVWVTEARLQRNKKWEWVRLDSVGALNRKYGIRMGRNIGELLQPSELYVQRRDGKYSKDKRTYGADPRKTKG